MQGFLTSAHDGECELKAARAERLVGTAYEVLHGGSRERFMKMVLFLYFGEAQQSVVAGGGWPMSSLDLRKTH